MFMLVRKLFICGKVHIQAILSSTFYLQSGHKGHVRCPFTFLAMYMHNTVDIHFVQVVVTAGINEFICTCSFSPVC